MTLDDGDKAIVKEIARAVGREIGQELSKNVADQIMLHAASCTAVKDIQGWRTSIKALVIGVAIGAALIGSGGTVAALKLLPRIF
jgi:hypothetical protein